MANEVKVVWLTGKTLTANVFQPDGSVRETSVSLSENATGGLYLGDCSTIAAGDVIIAYEGTTLIGSSVYQQQEGGIGSAAGVDPAGYVGDYKYRGTVYFTWRTLTAPSVNGTVKVYKDNGASEVTVPTGITDTRDFDSKTNVHLCTIDLSANSFYAKDADYLVVLSGATIAGVSVNAVIGSFSIEKRYQGLEWTKEG
jgi:hypothetical protein